MTLNISFSCLVVENVLTLFWNYLSFSSPHFCFTLIFLSVVSFFNNITDIQLRNADFNYNKEKSREKVY